MLKDVTVFGTVTLVTEEYWNVNAELSKQNQSTTFKAALTEYKGKKVKLSNKEEVDEVLKTLENSTYIVDSLKKTKTKSKRNTSISHR